jgi:4-oxalocrotonate tautomerase
VLLKSYSHSRRYDSEVAGVRMNFSSPELQKGAHEMPYVNVRLAGSLTREQKQKIAEEITDTLERLADKPRSYTYITFDEVKEENWAVAGELLDQV